MPVYLGDVPLDSAAVGGVAASAIYLGSNKIWPAVTFPYVVTDTNVTDADVPEGAKGCFVTLHGKGANGGGGASSSYTSAAKSVAGGSGGGGGGAIPRFFIPRSALGSTWSLTTGSDSRFVSGSITATAEAGSGRTGGAATVSGLSGVATIAGATGGLGSTSGGGTGENSTGAGAGGGGGGGVTKSTDALPSKRSGGGGGSASVVPATGAAPSGVEGAAGTSSGSKTSGSMSGGRGGGGGGAYPASGQIGGAGFARVEWVADHFWGATVTGAWTFTPPAWAQAGDLCDLIMIGGGAAGAGGSNSAPGEGGNAAAYLVRTLTLGVDLAVNGTLSGSVGAGGAPNSGSGAATTCTQLGLSAAGATGTSAGQAGKKPTPVTVGGTTYDAWGGGGTGGPSKGILGLGDGTADPGQHGCVLICVRGG